MTVQPIQPQDRRPSLKKTTAGSKKRKQTAMDAEAVGIRIDGRDYVVNPNDVTGRVEFEIRKECGMGVAQIVAAMEQTQGIDYLGMFMWAVRRINGEDVDLMDVLDSVSAAADVEVMKPGEVAAASDSAPKASGTAS